MDKIKVLKLKGGHKDIDEAMENIVNEFCAQHEGKIKDIRPILRDVYMVHYTD